MVLGSLDSCLVEPHVGEFPPGLAFVVPAELPGERCAEPKFIAGLEVCALQKCTVAEGGAERQVARYLPHAERFHFESVESIELRTFSGRESPTEVEPVRAPEDCLCANVGLVESVHVQVAVVVDVTFGGVFVAVAQKSVRGVGVQADA